MDVNLIGTGSNSNIESQVDPTNRALRTSLRHPEVLGSYRQSFKTGVVAAGMTGPLPIWEVRWAAPSQYIMIPRKLTLQVIASSTAFNATAADASFSLYRATGFTALDATGSATITFKGKDGALSQRMPASQLNNANFGGFAMLNTANTGLTGGTVTLDSNPMNHLLVSILASAAAETKIVDPPYPMLVPADAGRSPLEIGMSEGLVLRCEAITATGTWRAAVDYEWDEIDTTRWF